MEMLGLYSKIFLNSNPCSTCEKEHVHYLARLHKEGMQQITKNTTMTTSKYKFKIEGTVIHTPYGVYSQANMTDGDIEVICKEFPRFRNQFVNPPSEAIEVEDVDKENEAVQEAPKKRVPNKKKH